MQSAAYERRPLGQNINLCKLLLFIVYYKFEYKVIEEIVTQTFTLTVTRSLTNHDNTQAFNSLYILLKHFNHNTRALSMFEKASRIVLSTLLIGQYSTYVQISSTQCRDACELIAGQKLHVSNTELHW